MKKSLFLAFFLTAVFFFCNILFSFNVNELDKIKEKHTQIEKNKKVTENETTGFSGYLLKLQKKFNNEVASKIMELNDTKSISLFLLISLLVFGYGIIHTLGPGHGKGVVSGWILAKKRRVKDILIVSLFSGIFHAISSSLLVLVPWLILKQTVDDKKIALYLQVTGGLILLLIGLQMVFQVIRNKIKKKKLTEHEHNGHHHDHSQCEEGKCVGHIHIQVKNKEKLNPFFFAFVIGFVPCPIVSIVLIVCLSFNLLWQGLFFVLSLSLGMSVTILIISFGLHYLRETVRKRKALFFQFLIKRLFPVLAALLMIVSGLVFIAPIL